MKNVFAVLLIFSGICCLGGGLDRELNRVERWQDNASGVTKRTFDASEKAMRFDFTFRGNVDRWASDLQSRVRRISGKYECY